MAWNLVDSVSGPAGPGARRHFFVPLASIPVGKSSVRPIDRSLYSFSETYTTLPAPDGRTSDVSLNIQIQLPAGGLVDEDGNPDPLIRLHTLDGARIRYEPATGTSQNRLIVELLTFGFYRTPLILGMPEWFARWEDATSIPHVLIYENVDQPQLQTLLNGIAAPVNNLLENRVAPTNGLWFPAEVTRATKANFITQFLAGAADHFVYAESGTVIGTAAPDPADPSRRLLQLHAHYEDHTATDPHPMNPRELFSLVFGNDSTEATSHPLLVRLNEFGQNNQSTVHPESKRMLLRPPLRTWKRVEWEAEQEINNHQLDWRPAGSLGNNRFYNNHARRVGTATRRFNDGNYRRSNKCNLFVGDICIRAGFRACIHPVDATRWHFNDSNTHTHTVHVVAGTADRLDVTGANDDAGTVWGWKIENAVRAQPAASRQQYLNDLMQVEGRCFILAGAKPRKFRKYEIVGGASPIEGIADCDRALGRTAIGHIVIVKELQAEPQYVATAGEGLQEIETMTWQASGSGARTIPFHARLGGRSGSAASSRGFIRLHLIEMRPGGDPDTIQGLRSLNIQNRPRNLLNTPNEAAADARITHTPAGVALPAAPAPGNCCHDNHPPRNAPPTTVPC